MPAESAAVNFSDRLAAAVRRTGNPVCVGLDPRWESMPAPLRAGVDATSLTARAEVFKRFCLDVIAVVAPLVPIVKPQAAFFEQLGPAGCVALGEVLAAARKAGLLTILDGKRNDIGSTATAYADGYLGPDSPWGADSLTVSPYLGDDSLEPFVTVASARQCGLFVLVKTSNPGSKTFQDLPVRRHPLHRHVGTFVEGLAQQTLGQCGYGAVGAVVGATHPREQRQLRKLLPHCWFLVPGFGSQGATAEDVASSFDEQGLGAIVNNSRGILFAYQQKPYAEKYGAERWQAAVEAATCDMIGQLRAATPAGRLPGS